MKKKKSETFRRVKVRHRMILLILAVVLTALVCSCFFFQLILIQGDSMAPAYHHLQLAVLDKTDREFRQGAVIAFHCEELSSILVKRIIAGPGDTAWIREEKLIVNGNPSAVYPDEVLFAYAGLLDEPVLLGEDEYLVIGDNVAESRDSRYSEVGIVRKEKIIGKIIPQTEREGD